MEIKKSSVFLKCNQQPESEDAGKFGTGNHLHFLKLTTESLHKACGKFGFVFRSHHVGEISE